MRSWLILVAIMSTAAGLGACGGATKGLDPVRHSSSGKRYVIGDDDVDDLRVGEPEDIDDLEVRKYGQVGTAADARAMTPVLERYFAKASSGDGEGACTLLDSKLLTAPDLEVYLPKEVRPASSDTSVFRGKDCAQVESLLFELNRPLLAAESATLLVASVRINGNHALAVMRFKAMGERQIAMEREGGVWKIGALIDTPVV